jgi:hypothetical protein
MGKSKSTVNQYLAQKRKSYQMGGLSWKKPGMGNAMGMAGSLGSSLVDTFDPQDEYGAQTDVGAVGSGALKGASSLAMLGPIGMGVGAVAGGVMGLIGNNKAQDARDTAEQRKKTLDWSKALNDSQNILSSYDNQGTGIRSLKTGGVLNAAPGLYNVNPLKFKASKNTFQAGGVKGNSQGIAGNSGGNLVPIGESDSFEVQGNSPEATDDVQLGDAYVDHDEVVKPAGDGLRIFSDTLKPPGSKLAFSKLAKKLEKQKTSDEGRFPEQNKKIEAKLDTLFQTQQAMNGNSQGESVSEALQPAGETPGQGFNEGNMFNKGGMRTYHPITPKSFGSFQPIGFGSKVMAGANADLSSQHIAKLITGKLANPRGFHKGGTVAEKLFEVPGFAAELKTEPGHGPGAGTFQIGGNMPLHKSTFIEGYKSDDAREITRDNYLKVLAARKAGTSMAGDYLYDNWDDNANNVVKYFERTPTAVKALVGTDTHTGAAFGHQLLEGYTPLQKTSFSDLYGNKAPHEQMGRTVSSKYQLGGSRLFDRNSAREFLSNPEKDQRLMPDAVKAFYGTPKQSPDWDYINAGRNQMQGNTLGLPEYNPQISSEFKNTPINIPDSRSLANRNILSQGLSTTPGVGAPNFKSAQQSVANTANSFAPGTSTKPDWMGALGAAATLAPVFGNMAAARKLPPVADVYLNKPVNLKKLDYSDQSNALKQGLRTASLAAQQNSVNPNAQQAGMGNAQAQYMTATNQMHGDVNRQNTAIGNQQAMINTQIAGQNNMLMGQRSQAEQARASNMLALQSGNRADLSNKVLGLTAQENQKELDKQKYKMFTSWLNKQGAGLADRNPWMTQFKKGGKMSTGKLVRKAC